MSTKTIDKNQAIRFGYETTKKYFGLIFIFLMINLAYQAVHGTLDYFAGGAVDVPTIYAEAEKNDLLQQNLIDLNYVNRFGMAQQKLNEVTSAFELELDPIFENEREDIYNYLKQFQYRLPFPKIIYYIIVFGLWIFSIVLGMGMINIALYFAQGEKPEIMALFEKSSLLIPYILASICYGLVTIGGYILLIIPGIIFTLKFQFYSYILIEEENDGIIDSLKQSSRLTDGAKGQLLVFGFILLLVNLLGLLCLGVGLLISIPTTMIAMAHVYYQLKEQSQEEMVG